GGQQISVIVERLGRENLNAPIVGIADERRAAVRLGVRLNEFAHPFKTRPAWGRDRIVVSPQQLVTGQKRFEHQAVVCRRLLEVDAVWRRLIEDLVLNDGPAEGAPTAGAPRTPKEAAEKHQA